MGNGLAEVGLLAVLTLVVLPCCLFTLLALLDRFERNLDPDLPAPPALVVKPEPDLAELADESAGGEVVPLPLPITVAEAPAAATG